MKFVCQMYLSNFSDIANTNKQCILGFEKLGSVNYKKVIITSRICFFILLINCILNTSNI